VAGGCRPGTGHSGRKRMHSRFVVLRIRPCPAPGASQPPLTPR
jgi:hypothetical protein